MALDHGRSFGAFVAQRQIEALERLRARDALVVKIERRAAAVVTRDGFAKAVLKIEPAKLAVGDNVKADSLLQADRAIDRVVFGRAKLGLTHTAALVTKTSVG